MNAHAETDWGDAETDAVEEASHATILTFGLGGQLYAAGIRWVREVVDLCDIAPLPDAPHDMLGMIDLREEPIAVIDLAARLRSAADPGGEARIVILECGAGSETIPVGFIADRVLGVREFEVSRLEPVPRSPTGWTSEAASGMVRTVDGTALLLDLDRLLTDGGAGSFDFG